MSSKKDKLIEEAQRLVLRGQLDKAIKTYEQVMALEPSALNHRQKLAELLVKAGRDDDARIEFEAIGKKYASDGFNLKAIAVYKKLQGLFSGDIPITVTLASLYEKHGLVANALAEYKSIYDFYEKTSNTADALLMLEKMQNVDPQNVNIKHKLAEAYFHDGRKDESYSVFSKLAAVLHERGDVAAFAKLDARIQQLFPKKAEFALEVLAEQVASGNAASAVVGIQALLRTDPNNKRIWQLIIEAFTQLGQPQKVKLAYQHYLKCFPDELSAQVGLIGCLAAEKDLQGTLAMLDNYEEGLFAGRCFEDLEHIYRALEKFDPINLRVLVGLGRVCTALGKVDDVTNLQSKIQSLQGVSGKTFADPVQTQDESSVEPVSFDGQDSDAVEFGDVSFLDISTDGTEFEDQYDSGTSTVVGAFDDSEDEIELDVEFDLEDEFENSSDASLLDLFPEGVSDASGDVLLAEVGDLIDSIASKPRGVKFAGGLDGSDSQSHYDLGVAFREMGLYDEAINEFRQAATDAGRRLECLVLQGACLRDKGDFANSEKVLKSLLKLKLGLDDASFVKYELAMVYGDSGKKVQLVELLTEIDKSNSGFRDVRAQLDAADANQNPLDFSDDDLKGFDLK